MTESDRDYFQRRAVEERAAAASAADPAARRAHKELAERYEQVAAASLGAMPQVWVARRA